MGACNVDRVDASIQSATGALKQCAGPLRAMPSRYAIATIVRRVTVGNSLLLQYERQQGQEAITTFAGWRDYMESLANF